MNMLEKSNIPRVAGKLVAYCLTYFQGNFLNYKLVAQKTRPAILELPFD